MRIIAFQSQIFSPKIITRHCIRIINIKNTLTIDVVSFEQLAQNLTDQVNICLADYIQLEFTHIKGKTEGI